MSRTPSPFGISPSGGENPENITGFIPPWGESKEAVLSGRIPGVK